MKEMYYIYHISWYCSSGVGESILRRKNKINSVSEFNIAREDIEKKNGFEKVVIISFQLICTTDVWEEQ